MKNCPYCGSRRVARRGNYPKQRYQCTDKNHPDGTSRYFYGDTTPANVMLFDIETLPGSKYFWEMGEQDWNPDSIIKDWCVLSYTAKWLFQPKHISDILTPKEAVAHDDKRLMKGLWDLLNRADVVIAHNAPFDVPKSNWRFIIHDMAPPSPYKIVDTLGASRGVLKPTSRKLDWLAKQLGVGGKNHIGYQTWVECDQGDKKALRTMLDYNARDVYVLEDVYVKLRPWIKHPNMSLYIHSDIKVTVCPNCASDNLSIGKDYYTDASVFTAFDCNNCGAHGRHDKKKRTSAVRVVK